MKWPVVSLEDVLILEYGSALPAVRRNSSGSIPVAGSNGIDGYHVEALVKGPGIVVGRKGSAGKVTWFDSDYWPIDTTFYIRPKIPVDLRWIFYLLLHLRLDRLSIVTGVPGLNRNDAYNLKVPLPPRSEQRRIVEILNQADTLRKKRAEADAKSIRIMRAVFIKIFGSPDEWTSNSSNTRLLASLVEIYGGGTPSKKNPDFWKGEIPWVSPKDMKQDILYDSADHISPFAAEHANLKYISPGAVLVVVRGMILAHTVPIALAGSRLTINQDMKALEPKSTDIDSIYLYAALRVSDRMILSKVRTAAYGTRKIDTEELLQLPILIPSRHDSARFYGMMTQYNGTISRTVKTRGMIERLFENLLDYAFSGDLTAKWREGHMKGLLAEMREQTKYLAPHGTHKQRENAVQQESLF
jgi:type I restriction enzyme, S subunit